MSLSQESRNGLGYTRHPEDIDGTCFYCGDPMDRQYYDYVPPRDVARNPELRAMVSEPFIYVSSCHPCKTYLYPNRYKIRTPEDRRVIIHGRRLKMRVGIDEVRKQLAEAPLYPWQTYSTDGLGRKTIIDIPDHVLNEEERNAKTAFMSTSNRGAAQQTVPRTEGLDSPAPKDAPSSQGDARGATDSSTYDLGF